MITGVLLVLVSTFAYNGSAVLLAAETRRQTGDSNLLLALVRRAPGLFAVFLNILGWVLEVAALTLVPLTLVRILNVAGIGLLLALTRLYLKEPIGRREILGAGLISLGIVATSLSPPRMGGARPGLEVWVLLLLILAPGVLLPYAMRLLHRPIGPIVGAAAAGLAYALSGVLNKGIAYALQPVDVLPLALFATAVAVLGLLGFDMELAALRVGYASVVVPVVLALHTVVPVLCAPLLFGEAWPAGLLARVLLGGGIVLSVLGIFVLAGSSSHILAKGRTTGEP